MKTKFPWQLRFQTEFETEGRNVRRCYPGGGHVIAGQLEMGMSPPGQTRLHDPKSVLPAHASQAAKLLRLQAS